MSEEKNKNRRFLKEFLSDYLKKILPILLSSSLVLLIFRGIFKLKNFDFSFYILGLELSLFVISIYCLSSLLFVKKNTKLREEIEKLQKENLELKNAIKEEKSQIQEYFLLWIHQMKTPITSVKLLSEARLNQENLNAIRQNILHIENYSNMALNYLKLKNQASDLYITDIDLNEIIRENLRKYSILFISNKITLDYRPIEQRVTTDAKWFGVLFEQVLSNSIKYTKNGMITIGFDKEQNALEIKDTGIGIKKSDLPKIFERGYSGFNGKLQEKSTGIGLFLVDQISKKLNLKLTIDSALSKGTSFKIFFPKTDL